MLVCDRSPRGLIDRRGLLFAGNGHLAIFVAEVLQVVEEDILGGARDIHFFQIAG